LLQIDVGPFSLRELSRMVDLKMKCDWDHTSAIYSIIHNSQMGIKRHQMLTPDKVNPFRRAVRKKNRKVPIIELAKGFGAI